MAGCGFFVIKCIILFDIGENLDRKIHNISVIILFITLHLNIYIAFKYVFKFNITVLERLKKKKKKKKKKKRYMIFQPVKNAIGRKARNNFSRKSRFYLCRYMYYPAGNKIRGKRSRGQAFSIYSTLRTPLADRSSSCIN